MLTCTTGVQLDQVPLTDISKVTLANDSSIQEKDIGGAGTIVLRARRKHGSVTQFHLEARGQTLANKDGMRSSFARVKPRALMGLVSLNSRIIPFQE